MNFGNQKIQKTISFLIVISMLVPAMLFLSIPSKAQAITDGSGWPSFVQLVLLGGTSGKTQVDTATTTALKIREASKQILAEVLKGVARRLLQQMTKSTLNWINSGFHGAPLFVENPKSFFKDISKFEVKNFVDQIGYDSLRFPFGKDLALNTIHTYKRTWADTAQYSLSKVVNDPVYLDNYRNNFNVGGWDGFLLNTQYPQNNSIGFRLLATEEISKRLDVNDIKTSAGQVQNTLNQGLGFLSPETCPSNPKYNNLKNQFQQPSFKSDLVYDGPAPIFYSGNPEDDYAAWERARQGIAENQSEIDAYNVEFDKVLGEEMAQWADKNACPKGLAATTPGSTIGAMVSKSLGGGQDQTTLAAAMGNSVSQILDTLLNHFLEKGLNKLSSVVNPPPPTDDWTYEGQSLGTVQPYNSTAWDAGPDELVVLSAFKEGVKEGIKNTTEEIDLISKLTEKLNQTWPRVQVLDQCIPGPDYKWNERLEEEGERSGQKFAGEANDDNGQRAALAAVAYKSLTYAVDFFDNWIKDKMMLALPNSVNFIEVVDNSLEPLSQQSSELTDKKRVKTQALLRLKAIEAKLSEFNTEPVQGSATSQVIINTYKQYKATRVSVSSTESVEETRNDLNNAIDQLNNINKTITECRAERTQKGWAPAKTDGKGGAIGPAMQTTSILSGTPVTIRPTEKEFFCGMPIVGGFSHGEGEIPKNIGVLRFGSGSELVTLFNRITTPPRYPEIPMVNAANVLYSWGKVTGRKYTDVEISCNTIFRANVLDYKGSVRGLTTVSEGASGGGSSGSGVNSCVASGPFIPPATTTPTSVWNPPIETQTTNWLGRVVDNGWWPRLSPDGRYVAFGNFGGSWVYDFQTKALHNLSNPVGMPEGGRCLGGAWFNNTTLSIFCDSMPVSASASGWLRYNATVGEWIPKLTNDDTAMIGGYAIAAADGHWASVVHKWPTIPSEKLGIRKDGKLLTATVPPGATRHEGEELGNGIIGVSGNLLAHACDNTNEQICVWDGFNLKQIYDTQVPMWGATLKNDYIMYGGGPVRGITPDGEDVNLTLNSGLGEGVGQLFTVNGAMWVSTIVYEDSLDPTTFGYIYMRPWGQSSGFVIRGDPAGQLDIKQVGTDLRIAFANAVGHLTVVTIPVNTPRISLNGISTPVCTGSSSGIDIGVNTDTENVDTRIENSTPKDTDTSDTSTPPRTTGPNTPTPPTPTNTDSQVSYNTYGGSTASSTPGSYRVFTTLPPPAPTPAGGSQTSYSDGVSGTPTPDDFETGDRSFTPSPTPSTNTAPDSVNTGMDSTPPTPATDDEPSGRSKWIIIIGAIILLAVIFFMWRRFSNKSS